MADEGVLGTILGGGDDGDASGGVLANVLDPSAAAAAMELAKLHPQLADDAAAYFRIQTRLVDLQISRLKVRHFSDRVRAALLIFVSLVATAIAAVFLSMIYAAIHSHSVVIEPFSTPPVLAERGVNGRVLAQSLFDELARLREKTRAPILNRDLTNAWTNDIQIQVPETGLSIGEIERVLKSRFGHDVRIEGDLMEDPSGSLILAVRGPGIPAKSFVAPPTGLSTLIEQAANYVYDRSQPGSYSWYLLANQRFKETIDYTKTAYERTPVFERPVLLDARALALRYTQGDSAEQIALYRQAISIQPDFWVAYNNIMFTLIGLGEQPKVCQIADEMKRRAGGRPGKANELWYQHCDRLRWDLAIIHGALEADITRYGSHGQFNITSLSPWLIETEIQMHDLSAADLALQNASLEEGSENDLRLPLVSALLASERGFIDRVTARFPCRWPDRGRAMCAFIPIVKPVNRR